MKKLSTTVDTEERRNNFSLAVSLRVPGVLRGGEF
jgi:hypothetical protein